MNKYIAYKLLILLACLPSFAAVELHHKLLLGTTNPATVALTLDACSGELDKRIIGYLIERRVKATLFITAKWINQNPEGVSLLKANLDLFEIENHGEKHIPAVIGANKRVYGLAGEPDLSHLEQEVKGGAESIQHAFGIRPHWYRAATAEYEAQALTDIAHMGVMVAGFSVNADEGATLHHSIVERRIASAQNGDILIAHMNKPHSNSGYGVVAGVERLVQKGFSFVKLDQAEVRSASLMGSQKQRLH